jgi:acetyl esterase/lipase
LRQQAESRSASISRPPEIPPELRTLMAEIGPRWSVNRPKNIETMIERFSEVLRLSPRDDVEATRNISYGPHPRQELDVYRSGRSTGNRAAVLFVHGGAFMDGHRNRTDMVYSNVPVFFARHGVVGINVGYRLGGDAGYPGATEDVARALRWTQAHADELGIDLQRIFLMGHSAGAAHTGSYAYDRRRQPANGHGLAGHIVLSGRVRAENLSENPNGEKVVTYYGTNDAQQLDNLSPVTHVDANSVPTFVAWGEYENPLIDLHCAELVFRLSQAKRRSPPTVWLRGHNHTSTMAHIGTADDLLGISMLDFIEHPR